MKPRLVVQLFGEFSITLDEKPIETFHTARLQSLLAYLLLHHDIPQSRRHLAYRLWPDSSEANARNNLRQLVYQLRQALPEPDRFLNGDANSLGWQLDDDQGIDVVVFEDAIKQAQVAERQNNPDIVRYHLERAAQNYHGMLLPGIYDEWITPERERLHAQAIALFQKLITLQEQQREYSRAILTSQTLLLLDPLDEHVYLHLMNLHLQNQDRAGAIRVYQKAFEVLGRELSVSPGLALQEAYQRISQAIHTEPVQNGPDNPLDHPPLVGRRIEWQQLLDAWRRASDGSVGMVLITGEPGIGKSRLAEEMVLWADRQGFIAPRSRAYDIEGRLSLAPVAEWLRDKRYQTRLSSLDPIWLLEVSRLIPELRIHHPDLPKLEPITEYGQRQRFFEALARAILLPEAPILLYIDDLQWCDQETIEWLHFLLRFNTHWPLMLLGTARQEDIPTALDRLFQKLRASGDLTEIDLQPLDASETTKLANQTAGKELDLATVMRLYQETEGNPLYIIEMVQAGYQDRSSEGEATLSGEVQPDNLPPRMQAVILQRLTQLSIPARRIAEIGAVYGQPFSLELLTMAGHFDEDSTVDALDELWKKHIIREQAVNLYNFTHDKLRDVANSEVSAPQRRMLHRRLAQALESLYSENLEPVSGQIAAHYDQAGVPDRAIHYYQMAGILAASVYANDDAIILLKRGLELLKDLPGGAQRDALELSLQLAIAPPYRFIKGWTAPELGEGLNRALLLCDKVGTPAQRAQVLYGLQSLYVVEAKLEKVHYTYDEMHRLFLQTQGSSPQFAGLMYAGARLHMGQLNFARAAFEEIIAAHNPEQILDLQTSQGVNYLAHGNAWYAHVLWMLGSPDRAHQYAQEGVRIAGDYAQPFNQALTVTYLALLQELRADTGAFCTAAEAALALAEESRATYYRLWAQILVQFAHAYEQPSVMRLSELEDAIRAFTDTGARLRLPYYLSLLGRAYQQAGALDKAMTTIDTAMSQALNNNERCWDAELHRIRGEILLMQNADSADCEAAFRRAIEIANAQQALAFELRSAVSLAHLWQAQSRHAEGKQLLQPILDRFTEGQTTPDYQAAQRYLSPSK